MGVGTVEWYLFLDSNVKIMTYQSLRWKSELGLRKYVHVNPILYGDFLCYACLPSHPTSVNADDFSRDIATCLTSQEHNHTLKVVGAAPSPCRNSSHYTCVTIRIIDQSRVHIRCDVSGRDSVHVNALGDPLIRECLGQLGNTSLGSCVGRDSDATLEWQERSNIDNRSATASRELRCISRQQIGAEFTA